MNVVFKFIRIESLLHIINENNNSTIWTHYSKIIEKTKRFYTKNRKRMDGNNVLFKHKICYSQKKNKSKSKWHLFALFNALKRQCDNIQVQHWYRVLSMITTLYGINCFSDSFQYRKIDKPKEKWHQNDFFCLRESLLLLPLLFYFIIFLFCFVFNLELFDHLNCAKWTIHSFVFYQYKTIQSDSPESQMYFRSNGYLLATIKTKKKK